MISETQNIAITGATGFIGRHLLPALLQRPQVQIRALARNPKDIARNGAARLKWVKGGLDCPKAISDLLNPGGVLVHLAYPAQRTRSEHLAAAEILADAAAKQGISRVILCSTATVVGRTKELRVNENTKAVPHTDYEITKLSIENLWIDRASGRFDLVIARPSAVFGRDGKNLLKLANAIMNGSPFINYLRSCLYADRQMNLVAVENVVSAIELMINWRGMFNGRALYISDDDDGLNRFCDVERILFNQLERPYYKLRPLKLPGMALSLLLRLSGASNLQPQRLYDSTEMKKIGWKKVSGLEEALVRFAASLKTRDRGMS